jgi:hypothetical protein
MFPKKAEIMKMQMSVCTNVIIRFWLKEFICFCDEVSCPPIFFWLTDVLYFHFLVELLIFDQKLVFFDQKLVFLLKLTFGQKTVAMPLFRKVCVHSSLLQVGKELNPSNTVSLVSELVLTFSELNLLSFDTIFYSI